MLTKFGLKNFKSISEPGVQLALKPLTILFGPNGSGKSSILEGLALLTQSIHEKLAWSKTSSRAEGVGLVSFPELESFIHKGEFGNQLTMEIHVKIDEFEKKKLLEAEKGIDMAHLGLSFTQGDTIGYRYSCKFEPRYYEPRYLSQSVLLGEQEIIRTEGGLLTFPPSLFNLGLSSAEERILNPYVFRVAIPDESRPLIEPLLNTARMAVEIIASKLWDEGRRRKLPEHKVSYISALRGEVPFEGEPKRFPMWVGKRGEYLIPLLSHIFGSAEYEEKARKIMDWAEEFEVSRIHGGWRGDRNVLYIDYRDPELNTNLDLMLAGHGSRQIMSIITQLFWAEKEEIVLIEEPEISLHPESQAKLPELFADAISEGKQIIVTTHSDFFPYALRKAVVSEKHPLKVEDVTIYEVEKGKEGTRAISKGLDESGYIEGWIPSFVKVDKELSNLWLETLEEE